MKIILVAGGSGGHIYPCLEMAKYFKIKGHDVLLCGCENSMEEKIYIKNGLTFKGVSINRNKLSSFIVSTKEIKNIYKSYMPDLVFLFGNYISVSFAFLAVIYKIPIYLHEQNVIYGRANKLLGIFAKRVYLSLPIKKDIHKGKSLLIGNPKSDSMVNNIKLVGKYNVVIAMGSLGSNSINEILKKFIDICDENIDFHIVLGEKHYKSFIKEIKIHKNIHLYSYLDNLTEYIKSCDLFISRAGATTISEILVNGVASILIPSPYVKDNHQYFNAKYLLDNKACMLLEESKVTAEILNDYVRKLVFDYKKLLELRINARKLAIYDSKNKIYQDMVKINER